MPSVRAKTMEPLFPDGFEPVAVIVKDRVLFPALVVAEEGVIERMPAGSVEGGVIVTGLLERPGVTVMLMVVLNVLYRLTPVGAEFENAAPVEIEVGTLAMKLPACAVTDPLLEPGFTFAAAVYVNVAEEPAETV